MAEDPLRWLLGLERFGVRLGLGAVRVLLAALGDPQSGSPSILIGGTNGKGSVAGMLDAILGRAGLRAGLYTSPHLVRPNERIRIAGKDIATPDLCRHLQATRVAAEDALAAGVLSAHPSFFEVLTAAALLSFREAAVDIAVLEVGLGGRLDATNVVDAAASVIVTVDLDHTERLGVTIAEIAREKAGIVKAGRTLVTGVTQPEALDVLREVCAERRCGLIDAHTDSVLVLHDDSSFSVTTGRRTYDRLRATLPGRHQMENARVAVLAVEALSVELGLSVTPEVVREGMAAVRWPGRLQWIASAPPLLLDGAHNPAGARALSDYLREHPGPRPVLVFASLKDKDAAAILDILADRVRAVVLTRPGVQRARDPLDLEPLVRPGIPTEVVQDPVPALERARRLAGSDGLVLVAGSLYLVGEILGALEGGDRPDPIAM